MFDDYLYSGASALINRFGIQDKAILDQIENDITADRVRELLSGDPDTSSFSPKLDENLLKGIHKFLFSDVYDWAGEYRHCNIAKAEPLLNMKSVDYPSPASFLDDDRLMSDAIAEAFEQLQTPGFKSYPDEHYFDKLAYAISALWTAHPFREGNTRTTAIFLHAAAKSHGRIIAGDLNDEHTGLRFRDMLVMASIGDFEPLKSCLRRCVVTPEKTVDLEIDPQTVGQRLQAYRQHKNDLNLDDTLERNDDDHHKNLLH